MKVYFNFKDDLVFFVQILCKYKHFRGKQCKLLWSYRGPLTPYKKSEKLEKKNKKKKKKKEHFGANFGYLSNNYRQKKFSHKTCL